MKVLLIPVTLLLSVALSACGPVGTVSDPEKEPDFGPGFFQSVEDTTDEDLEGGETNTVLPTPEQVEILERKSVFEKMLSFPQTKWNECAHRVTGNYSSYNCAASRTVSVILDEYLQNRLISCVDAGLGAQGGGTAKQVHLNHAGITGDARHSPKSLHAVNRAIDLKMIKVVLTNGVTKEFTYSKLGNRPFYTALRKCWGKTVHEYNGCPYYSGNSMLTGSIGWENSAHGSHMHLSVPYCVSGRYGSGLWVR